MLVVNAQINILFNFNQPVSKILFITFGQFGRKQFVFSNELIFRFCVPRQPLLCVIIKVLFESFFFGLGFKLIIIRWIRRAVKHNILLVYNFVVDTKLIKVLNHKPMMWVQDSIGHKSHKTHHFNKLYYVSLFKKFLFNKIEFFVFKRRLTATFVAETAAKIVLDVVFKC